MQGTLERAKKLVFKAKFCRYIKIFQKILTPKTGFLSVPKLVRFTPARHREREITFYGVALVREQSGRVELITAYNDLTDNKAKALTVVIACNKDKPDHSHLGDITMDLL